jgi:hypothetical protein
VGRAAEKTKAGVVFEEIESYKGDPGDMRRGRTKKRATGEGGARGGGPRERRVEPLAGP